MKTKTKKVNREEVLNSLRDYLKKYGYVANEMHFVSIEAGNELKKVKQQYIMGHMVVYTETKLMPTIVITKPYVYLLVSSEELPHANIYIYEVMLNK